MTVHRPICLALPCAILTISTASAKDRPLERNLRSPNGKLRAVIHTEGEGSSESIVEIWRGKTPRFHWSGTSRDGEHGWVIEKVAWTSDGKFFVFSASSSGGHQPWHHPTFAYHAGTNTLLPLDKVAGPITDAAFRLEKGDVLRTRVLKGQDVAGKAVVIRLRMLKVPGNKPD